MKTMKSLILILTVLLFVSCQNDEMNIDQTQSTVDSPVLRECVADEVLQSQLVADPTLANRMNTINEFVKNKKGSLTSRMVNGQIVIPIVVNIVYNKNFTTVYKGKTFVTENITDAQVISQIAVLNKDFNAENTDFTPDLFSPIKGNTGIRFVLDTIIRKGTDIKIWPANSYATNFDKVKVGLQNDPSTGISPTDPTTKLNIWVCNTDVKGYAQFPGGNVLTDGIVVSYKWFGDFSGANLNLFKPSSCAAGGTNLGKTTTHEIGHWLNIRHTFTYSCSGSEFPTNSNVVDDTPTQFYPSSGLPVYPNYSTCTSAKTTDNPNGILMTMNFMDYTADKGKSMFTKSQVIVMKSMFLPGGARSSFAQ